MKNLKINLVFIWLIIISASNLIGQVNVSPVLPLNQTKTTTSGNITTSNTKKLKLKFQFLRDTAELKSHFKQATGVKSLRFSNLNANSEKASITVEYFSDLLVPGRLAFSGSLSVVDTSMATPQNNNTDQQALETFLNNGGNGSLSWAIPYFFIENNESRFRLYSYLLPKVSAILPVVGSSGELVDFNFDLANEMHLNVISYDGVFNIFASARCGIIFSNQEFRDKLDIDSDGAFAFGQASIGFNIQSTVSISANLMLFGPDSIKENYSTKISVIFTPK